ncbi:MAG: DUF4331 domain-containing protein [Solirubrobacterales bacterium]|nr:DUF4331 domain-containing protein [Solirubrobacterales bacterium]
MSSHREAPAISRDPVADNTDLYAFVSPDDPGSVTIISNYIPLEAPFGGPNFFEFGPDVRYRINIDNDGDGDADVVYEFAFQTTVANADSFLYNSGPILSLDSANWNRKQFYSVTRISRGRSETLAENLACPPCNIGPLSTPDYDMLASQAIHSLPGGRPELLRVRRRRAVRDSCRQRRRRPGRHHLPVPLQDRARRPEHVPV